MTHATEADLGPLIWVKGEIDAALTRAGEALERADGDDAASGLQFAQTHLHQVRGALSIVGLDGLTQFTDALEQLLGAMSRGERPGDAAARALVRRSLAVIGNYLDELAHGAPDQALRLAPHYLALADARGQADASAADLFHPDLSRRPPARDAHATVVPDSDAAHRLRAARSRFERGLLDWLRRGAAGDGARAMRDAIAEVEAVQPTPAARSLWWVCLAFLDALAQGDLKSEPAIRRLCTQIDAQFRRLMSGAPAAPDRLLRELLYQVAITPAHTEQQAAVKACWQLEALIPEAGASIGDTPIAPLLDALNRQLAVAREHWDEFCSGTAVALARFEDAIGALSETAPPLGRPAAQRLVDGVRDFAHWLRRDPLQFSDAGALEIATGLLLLETAFERRPPERSFGARADTALARLAALQRGETVGADSALDSLAGAGESQEKAAIAQLAKEMLASLAHVEQVLDDFFRNQAKREPLLQLHKPLQQIIGALSMLGETDALGLVRDAAVRIAGMGSADSSADQAEFEALAHQLSALGFYIEALPRGGARLDALLAPSTAAALSEAPVIESEPATQAMPEPEIVADAFAFGAATASGGKPATHAAEPADAEPLALPDAPEALSAPESLAVPEALPVAEGLAAPEGLAVAEGPAAPEMPAVLAADEAERPAAPLEAALDAGGDEGGDDVITLVEDLEFDLAPPQPAILPATPPRAAPATAAEVDAELLGIFIEEALEVLSTLREHLALLRSEPTEPSHLVTIRRSFHTLKGSGRMVGLVALGEVAWAVEQTLNRWLQLDWPVTPALLHLIDEGEQRFAAWVAALQQGGIALDASALVSEAERLRAADTPPVEPMSSAPPTLTEPPAAADEAEPFVLSDLGFPTLPPSPEGEALPLIPEPEPEPAPAAEPAAPAEMVIEAADFLMEGELGAPTPAGVSQPDRAAQADAALAAEPVVSLEALEEPDALEVADSLDALAPLEEARPIDALEAAEADDRFVALEGGEEAETAPTAAQQASPEPILPPPDVVQLGEHAISRALHELYCAEAAQHLDTLGEEFARLRAGPTAPPSLAALRAAHTFAGISGTAHLSQAQALGRALEHALERLRDGDRAPLADEQALLAASLDTLRGMLADICALQLPAPAVELAAALDAHFRAPRAALADVPGDEDAARAQAPTPPDVALKPAAPGAEAASPPPALPARGAAPQDDIDSQLLPIFLEEASELLGELHATLRRWRGAPAAEAEEAARAVARLLHSLKGSARMAGAMTLGEHLHQLESRLEDGLTAKDGTASLVDELAFGLDVSEHMVDTLALEYAEGAGADASADTRVAGAAPDTPSPASASRAVEAEPIASPTLRVRAELIDRFVNQAGEIGVARSRIDGELRTLRRSLLDLTENVIRLRNQLREVEIQAEVQMQSRIAQAGSHEGQFDPLELDRYTRLQELTRMMAESVNDVTTVQQNLLHNLDGADIALNGQARMSRDLQQGLMQVRMLPFDSLASRLYRVVRQSAKELGKRASLDLRGGRIEIDRSVLEQMAAPLEHLLRNAVAHGIEAPALRAAAGKPETGRIDLKVTQEGNEIAIEIADDGAGLDFERIAARARSRGLLAADEHPDDKRLTNLIFVSGFSTATELSAVSGRGVGMDVVKAQTAAAGGRVDVVSRRGAGTRFQIRLPLTLAVTQALLVRAGGRSWAIPSSMVAQALELKPDALRKLQEERGIDWQGERFAYRYLPRLLGDREARPEEQRYNWVLLLRAGAQTLALHVDSLRGNQEIIVKNAGPQLTRIIGMSGATVLGDGEVVLILNPVALASRGLAGGGEDDGDASLALEAAPPPLHLPTVMVVDDSLTVRKITGRLLEREGYRVITAKDGVEALEQLIDSVPDVILSDIEMPRMDGFDLVRNIRADARLAHLPVVMITSRLADKHRQYAKEIGANHYLGKPYQEEELLALVARYTARRPAPARV
ncbi:Hpt domain-containing protein [Thauera sp. WH-1]|uniref:Hpt domain-containing protein n=1 Tax=Thauera sp. WH-1 TaxID=3398230 RepID=UPI0039FD5E97